jgi:hypothetical protein
MSVSFEEAVAAVAQVLDTADDDLEVEPDSEVAPYGYESGSEWLVLLLPLTLGAFVAAVDQETGTVRWIMETDPAYTEETPAGDWSQADDGLVADVLPPPIDYTALFAAGDLMLVGPDGVAHSVFCRNPLHPGPCRGWRRQVDVAPEQRRDRMPEAEHRRERNRQTREQRRNARPAPARPAAPARREGEHAVPTGTRGSDGFAPAPVGRDLGTPDRVPAVSAAMQQQVNDWSTLERARYDALTENMSRRRQGQPEAPVPPGPPNVGKRDNSAIAQVQGFDAHPLVVGDAEMDAAIAAGGVEFWRGMSDAYGADDRFELSPVTGADMVEQMRSGPAYYGYGVYGNGIYGGDDHRIAVEYAANTRFGWPPGGPAASNGAVVRAVLRPGSRVIEYADAKRARERWLQDMRNHEVDQRMSPVQRGEFRDQVRRVSGDLGVWAAMMGYDAIYADEALHVGSEGDNSRHWNILNRAALMVSQTTEPVVQGQTTTPTGRRR